MHRNARRMAALTALTTASLALAVGTAAAQPADMPEPDTFTSMFTVMGSPDNVVSADNPDATGTAGATGTFNFRINSDEEIICYDITLRGVNPPYQSPADTATHIHEGAAGQSGPPRVIFPDPTDAGDGTLRSEGCVQGPFTTGVVNNGVDAGEGFSLKQIEANPAGFYADTHTAESPAGAVRGQLTAVPMGGVETGAGGASDRVAPLTLGAAVLAGAAGAGALVLRRRAQS